MDINKSEPKKMLSKRSLGISWALLKLRWKQKEIAVNILNLDCAINSSVNAAMKTAQKRVKLASSLK